MSKRTTIYLAVILLVIAIFGFTFFLVDFNLAVRGDLPKLSLKAVEYNDGNSLCYVGIGYKIIIYNIDLEERQIKCGTYFLTHDPDLEVAKNSLEDDENAKNNKYIIGEITEIYKNGGLQILVKSTSKDSLYNEALVNVLSSTVITKEKSNIYKNDLKVGDKVKISIDGIATKSIPPQVSALEIEVEN